jgi:hypothetical protein
VKEIQCFTCGLFLSKDSNPVTQILVRATESLNNPTVFFGQGSATFSPPDLANGYANLASNILTMALAPSVAAMIPTLVPKMCWVKPKKRFTLSFGF